MSWLYLVLGLTVIGGMVATAFAIARLRDRRVEEVARALQGRQILKQANSANFFGRQSLGLGQVRGNGVLALTPQKLYFLMYLPRREFIVNTASITGIERTKWFLKKSKGRDLLLVKFTDSDGGRDAMAWLVPDLEEWERAVRDAASSG